MLKLQQVVELTTLSYPTIYRLMAKGLFPRQVKIGGRRVAWRKTDIDAFIQTGAVPQSK